MFVSCFLVNFSFIEVVLRNLCNFTHFFHVVYSKGIMQLYYSKTGE